MAMIPERCKEQRQCREPLLAVDDEVGLNADRAVERRRRQDHRAHEVRCLGVLKAGLRELDDVVPQALQLLLSPGVGALVERNAVLPLALEQALEVRLLGSDHCYLPLMMSHSAGRR